MMYHLSLREGVVTCIHRVFLLVSGMGANEKVLYVNNSTPGALRRALSESREQWITSAERMKNFQYERVNSLDALLGLLEKNHDLVVIEHLDRIVLEPTDNDYATRNKKLADILLKADGTVFIDDWEFLQRYYLFTELQV